MQAGPIPLFPQGANDEPQYEYKSWPAYRFRKDGTGQIFDRPEDVPDGWYTRDELDELAGGDFFNEENDLQDDVPVEPDAEPEDTSEQVGEDGVVIEPVEDEKEEEPSLLDFKAEEEPRQLTPEQRASLVGKLIDENSQTDLVAMIDLMNEGRDDEIEFSRSWPKKKLAETIADNGGPLED